MGIPRYKKKFWLIAALMAFVLLFGIGALSMYLVRFTGTSTVVCKSCHPELMPLWQNSHGHPAEETSCFECHSHGPQILPNSWNILRHVRDQISPPEYLADDDLTSQRCLDCHEQVLNLGYEPKKKVIKFTHRYHIQEGMNCVDCHRNAGHEYMNGGTNRPTVMECINCHIKEFTGHPKSAKCLNCHDVILAPGKAWK